LDSFEFGDFPL